MRLLRKRNILLPLLIVVSGCGSGSSGVAGQGAGGQGNNPVDDITNLRTYRSGDRYIYSLNGTFVPTGGVAEPFTGTLTQVVSSDSGGLTFQTNLQYKLSNGNIAGYPYIPMFHFTQSGDGSVTLNDDTGNIRKRIPSPVQGSSPPVTILPIVMPGKWPQNLTSAWSALMDNADQLHGTSSVISGPHATTLLGTTVNSYTTKVEWFDSHFSGQTLTGEYRPNFGGFITLHGSLSIVGRGLFTFDGSLTTGGNALQ